MSIALFACPDYPEYQTSKDDLRALSQFHGTRVNAISIGDNPLKPEAIRCNSVSCFDLRLHCAMTMSVMDVYL